MQQILFSHQISSQDVVACSTHFNREKPKACSTTSSIQGSLTRRNSSRQFESYTKQTVVGQPKRMEATFVFPAVSGLPPTCRRTPAPPVTSYNNKNQWGDTNVYHLGRFVD
jgi:hypothetical protein